MRRSFLLFILLSTCLQSIAQQTYIVTGRITDSQGIAIPFASVYVKKSTTGTNANERGVYQLRLTPGKYNLAFRFTGYKQAEETVEVSNHNVYLNGKLGAEEFQSAADAGDKGKDDPAFGMIRNAIAKRKFHLNQVKEYSCNVYIKGAQKLISAPKTLAFSGYTKDLVLDTNGRGILYQSEAVSQFNYQHPDKVKEVMLSSKVVGNNNAFDINRAASLQVNFYKNLFDINGLYPRGFISPIADNALTYYKYKFDGALTENGRTIDKIEVIPLRDHDPVFRGVIYLVDGEWRIYSAQLSVTKKSNINFVDTLTVNQQYFPVKDDQWEPASLNFTYNGDLLGFKFNGYILGVFSDYNLNPNFPAHFFNGEAVRVTGQSTVGDSIFWAKNRPVPLTTDERRNYNYKDSVLKKHSTPQFLDSAERAHNKFSFVTYALLGDTINHSGRKESIIISPLYETVLFNTVEGLALNLKATYRKQYLFGKELSVTPNFRYGFADKQLNANVAINQIYNPQTHGEVYGRFGSNILDLNSESSVSPFINTISTLLFKENYLKLYRSTYVAAGTKKEIAKGLLVTGELEYAYREALVNHSYFKIRDVSNLSFTSNNPLKPLLPDTLLFSPNKALTLRLSATYTFDEQYTTTPNGRSDEPSKYPQIMVHYRKGIKSLFGSDVDYDYADIQVIKERFKLGIYGYSSFLVVAGKFFNNTALIYPDYKQFRGNQGITFDPTTISSFHFLPYYTYNNTSFFEAHYEHNFSGFLFNKVPGLRNLKLEEIAGANYLAQQSQPDFTEFYVGLQRFFLRVDYGITYSNGGKLSQGIRLYYGF
jgi:hypothetical protein